MSDTTTPLSSPATPSLRMHSIVFATAGVFVWLMLINDDWGDSYTHFLLADRIVKGQIPYRDFFMFFLPAPAYTLAAWFKLFGYSAEGLRILMAICGAITVTLAFHISSILISGPLRWIGAAGVLSAFIVGNEGLSHMAFSIPMAMTSIALALHAEKRESQRLWFLSAIAAAIAGLFTQTIGAWLGLAVLLSGALTARSARKRVVNLATIAGGGCAVLLPMLLCILYWKAWEPFYYNFCVWPLERYAPYHAGVGWGSWLPPWSMLLQIPPAWRLVWLPALSITWGCVWVLPLVPMYSIIQSMRSNAEGRRVLSFACAAMFLSAFPHAGAMRLVRISGPVWILLAMELNFRIGLKQDATPNFTSQVERIVAAALTVFLLFATGLQWSYREQLVPLHTPRGNVLVHENTRGEFDALQRHVRAGGEVLAIPESGAAVYLLDLRNPTGYDVLLPVMFSPVQLSDAAQQLRARNFPAIVLLDHPQAHQEWIMATFKPSKYLDEFEKNPFNDFLRENYAFDYQDGGVMGLKHKEKTP